MQAPLRWSRWMDTHASSSITRKRSSAWPKIISINRHSSPMPTQVDPNSLMKSQVSKPLNSSHLVPHLYPNPRQMMGVAELRSLTFPTTLGCWCFAWTSFCLVLELLYRRTTTHPAATAKQWLVVFSSWSWPLCLSGGSGPLSKAAWPTKRANSMMKP